LKFKPFQLFRTKPVVKYGDIDNLDDMQTNADTSTIDARITELTEQWMHEQDEDMVAPSLEPTLGAMFNEGLNANQGGKRLRALLALAAFNVYGQGNRDDDSPMLDLACAIEIYQTSALIHDDIIDDSPLRRGKPTAHMVLQQATQSSNNGKGLALMLGNMLATASTDVAATALANPTMHHPKANLHTFLAMQRAVEIGQGLDSGTESISLKEPSELVDASLNVFAWKTASYTTIAPLELGLCAAGMAPDRAKQNARAIGLPLGTAFQLSDDLLDVVGTTGSTGKPIGGDVRNGKRTVLLADAMVAANKEDTDTLKCIYESSSRSDEDVRTALNLLVTTGSVQTSRQRIAQLWKQTQAAINDTELAYDSKTTLKDICAQFIPQVFRQASSL
jgi:geranylgeranyl diphosphate synthase, type I